MKTKSKRIFWTFTFYVILLLVLGGVTFFWKFRTLHVDDYRVTTLKIDKSKPVYYVELDGKLVDVSVVKASQNGTSVLKYEGLEVTVLKVAERDCVYVFSGALPKDEVLQNVQNELCAPWATVFSLVLFFGGMFVLVVYKHGK